MDPVYFFSIRDYPYDYNEIKIEEIINVTIQWKYDQFKL